MCFQHSEIISRFKLIPASPHLILHRFPPADGVLLAGVAGVTGVAGVVPRRWERKRLLIDAIRLKPGQTRTGRGDRWKTQKCYTLIRTFIVGQSWTVQVLPVGGDYFV